ncbi:DUF1642 domain-containing protein [Vagococcus lutrae]|uniref:DUF1642 domain-containing protein n=1 Tax=Vagococcus lutrae TaxID=81947 RepID=UPI00288C9421|nr:DUF1642 domain-containing protein [Vagococcus lutrae]MDT2801915.1 DUF1642 domain-containing protein [Vagococcus lutrae]
MSEKVKIYHVETQEDYDDLMIELEKQGYKWMDGDELKAFPQYWDLYKGNTCIILNGWMSGRLTRCSLEDIKEFYPNINVIKHKAKGAEQLEKVAVPKFVADYIENHYGTKPDVWDKADLIRDFDMYLECYGNPSLQKWVKNDDNFLTLITAIITNDYEVEEEKKYYWRKKKEYMFSFEDDHYIYVNINKKTQQVHFHNKVESEFIRTVLSETEVKQLVSEEDLNKLERIEIDDVQ